MRKAFKTFEGGGETLEMVLEEGVEVDLRSDIDRDGTKGGLGILAVVGAGDREVVEEPIESGTVFCFWIRDFCTGAESGDLGGSFVIFKINTEVIFFLVAGDIALGGDVVVEVVVDIEMVGFDSEDDGDMGGFFEVPKLETAHLIDNGIGHPDAVEDIKSGSADVADEMDLFVEGLEEGGDKGAGCALSLCAGDANNWDGAATEEIASGGSPAVVA